MNLFTDSHGRLQPVWAFVLSALLSAVAFLAAGYLAGMVTGDHVLIFELVFRSLLAALLLAMFLWLLTVADHVEKCRLARLGLPAVRGWRKHFLIGLAMGGLLTTLGVVPILIWSSHTTRVRWTLHSAGQAGVVLIVLVTGALAEELMFRGYPFQHLEAGIGPTGAILVFSVLFGAVHLGNPNASSLGLINTVLIGVMLAIAYLRTRALWLPWGIHLGWNATLGLLFGLPVSGIRLFNVVIRTSVTGPRWLTGGDYGLEASLPCVLVLLLGIAAVWKMPLRILWAPTPQGYEVAHQSAPKSIQP